MLNTTEQKTLRKIKTSMNEYKTFYRNADRQEDGNRKTVQALEAKISPLIFAQKALLEKIVELANEEIKTPIDYKQYREGFKGGNLFDAAKNALSKLKSEGGSFQKTGLKYAAKVEKLIDAGYFNIEVSSNANNPMHAISSQKTAQIMSEVDVLFDIMTQELASNFIPSDRDDEFHEITKIEASNILSQGRPVSSNAPHPSKTIRTDNVSGISEKTPLLPY